MEWHWVPRATEIFEACDEDPKLSLMLSTEFLLEITRTEEELCERAASWIRELILNVSKK
ncbi:uncharacterized protein N7529_002324 [Penicillium soppii]|uniref:uncharacterized protein n=1 Tax=Penicillium soppii TaxID=69789 RepID=UPI002546E636|nr:uncharacterized protein N7529_002324 [Penicillium soppii]KAJ5873894.1 hypothetical protein N7529_002324 [Penicillium soppii]